MVGDLPWTRDEKFGDQFSRWQNQHELDDHMSEWTADKDYKDLMHELQASGVRAAAVYTNQDVVEDPHLNDRGYFWEINHPASGTMVFSGTPVLLSKTPGSLIRPAPLMGQHNRLVLGDLVGLTNEQVNTLEAENAIGTQPPEAHQGPPY